MKYTIEIKATIEDDNVYTDEELREYAKEFLENFFDAGKMTITTEDGRVVEVTK